MAVILTSCTCWRLSIKTFLIILLISSTDLPSPSTVLSTGLAGRIRGDFGGESLGIYFRSGIVDLPSKSDTCSLWDKNLNINVYRLVVTLDQKKYGRENAYFVSNRDINWIYCTIPSPFSGTLLKNCSHSSSEIPSSKRLSIAARNCSWVTRPSPFRSILLKMDRSRDKGTSLQQSYCISDCVKLLHRANNWEFFYTYWSVPRRDKKSFWNISINLASTADVVEYLLSTSVWWYLDWNASNINIHYYDALSYCTSITHLCRGFANILCAIPFSLRSWKRRRNSL